MFYNENCIQGARKYLADNTIDLIITDPPYGIKGDQLDKHYNRNESTVIDGYIDVPIEEYEEFTNNWIKEAERVLKPGGSIYIVSGYTNLRHILNALADTNLQERNHIIWKYNFGVYTKNKYISSHYHILYYIKPKGNITFNTYSFFSDSEKDENNNSLNYKDREDVWAINKEFKPGIEKNKNQLPTALLSKMILYSSKEGDLICDFFLGSFSTAKVAIGLKRKACGFELNKKAYDIQIENIKLTQEGYLLDSLRTPPNNKLINKGKPLDANLIKNIKDDYIKIRMTNNKSKALDILTDKYGRGRWSLTKIVDGTANKSILREQSNLF